MTMTHDYLHELNDTFRDSPMAQKLRRLAPMPIGCVFIQWPQMSEDDVRGHLRAMKRLGFTCIKGHMLCGGMTVERFGEIALEEGIIPWWYDIGGWEDITPELLTKIGLAADMDIDEAIEHPKMIQYQEQRLRQRLVRKGEEARAGKHKGGRYLPASADAAAVPGVVKSPEGTKLPTEAIPHFIEWLKKTYADVEALKHAWNCYSSSFGGGGGAKWQTWDDVAEGLPGYPQREFRHLRDILRFKADVQLDRLRQRVAEDTAIEPDEPIRAGGEISIFLPHTSWAIDMEGYAEIMAEAGAFYPSMHPGWHLEEVHFELVRPTFMQASMCADWARGKWSAPLESSGGPQWWSGGGKAHFVPEVQQKQPAFTFTPGTMTQLIYSYLGAGFRGFGLWCWNPRDAGWEAGEYALCDRNNNVTPRAERVGQIGQAMRRLRRELWQAHKEPWVGLYQDWENDATWAALATPGRESYKMDPIRARIGAARALINANVPWEHITGRPLAAGLAPRYRSIYLPATIRLSSDLIELLTDYVRQGGRVVLDMPGAWLDERAHLVDTSEGSGFEQLFGAVLHEYGYANNIPHRLDGQAMPGFTAVLTPTSARTLASYDTGGAAITENPLGSGTAVILGAQASLACMKPGNTAMEKLLVETALGSHEVPFTCHQAIVYRLAAPAADHYFLINDGPEQTVALDVHAWSYQAAADAVTGEPIDLGAIELEAHGGRWVRCEK